MSYDHQTVVLNPLLDPGKNSKTHRTLIYGKPRSKKARAEAVFQSFNDDSRKPLNLTRDTFYAALNQVDLSNKKYRDALLAGMQNFPELRKFILSEAFPGLLNHPPASQEVNLSGITLAELGLTDAEKETALDNKWAEYNSIWFSSNKVKWERLPANKAKMSEIYTRHAQKITAPITSNTAEAKPKLTGLFNNNIDFAYKAFSLIPAHETNIPKLAELCVHNVGVSLAALQGAEKSGVFAALSTDQINALAKNAGDLPYNKRKIYFPALMQALCSLSDPANQDKKLDLLSLLKNSQNPIEDLSLLKDYVKTRENTPNNATALKDRITAQAPEIFVALMKKTGNSSKVVTLMREYIIKFIDDLPTPLTAASLTPESARQLKLLFNPDPVNVNGAVPHWTDFLNLSMDKVLKIATVFHDAKKTAAFITYHCPKAAENPRNKHPVLSLLNRIFGFFSGFFAGELNPLKQACVNAKTYEQWDAIIARPALERAAEEQRQQTEAARLVKEKADADAQAKEEAERVAQEQREQAEAARLAKEKADADAKAKEEAERVAQEQRQQTEATRLAKEKADADAKAKKEAERVAQEQRQQAEAARLAKEKADADAKAKEEAERVAQEQRQQAEAARLAKEKADADAKAKEEAERVAQEQRQQAEAARLAKEKADADAKAKEEAERVAQEKRQEKQRLADPNAHSANAEQTPTAETTGTATPPVASPIRNNATPLATQALQNAVKSLFSTPPSGKVPQPAPESSDTSFSEAGSPSAFQEAPSPNIFQEAPSPSETQSNTSTGKSKTPLNPSVEEFRPRFRQPGFGDNLPVGAGQFYGAQFPPTAKYDNHHDRDRLPTNYIVNAKGEAVPETTGSAQQTIKQGPKGNFG